MLKAIPEQYADKEIAKFYLINKINNKKYYIVDSMVMTPVLQWKRSFVKRAIFF